MNRFSMNSSKKALLAVGIVTVVLVGFQNCGAGIAGFDSISSASMSHSSVNELSSHTKVVDFVGKYHMPLGDRSYISSVLLDVFDYTRPDSELSSAERAVSARIKSRINAYVGRRADIFKGVCDEFNVRNACISPRNNKDVTNYGMADVKRNSLLIKTCDILLEEDAVVLSVLQKIEAGENFVDSQGLPLLRADSVRQMVNLFYLGHELNDEVIEAFLQLGEEVKVGEGDLISAWRAVITATCHSPGWQLN